MDVSPPHSGRCEGALRARLPRSGSVGIQRGRPPSQPKPRCKSAPSLSCHSAETDRRAHTYIHTYITHTDTQPFYRDFERYPTVRFERRRDRPAPDRNAAPPPASQGPLFAGTARSTGPYVRALVGTVPSGSRTQVLPQDVGIMSDDSVGNNVGQESKAGEPRRPILRKMTSQAGVREGGAGRVPRGGEVGREGGRA